MNVCMNLKSPLVQYGRVAATDPGSYRPRPSPALPALAPALLTAGLLLEGGWRIQTRDHITQCCTFIIQNVTLDSYLGANYGNTVLFILLNG